ncbi:MAG: hypothetical protein J6B02_05710 [Selenomonadales bacterium]|nr:hypothetical protein [Selenomonadales bacterium]
MKKSLFAGALTAILIASASIFAPTDCFAAPPKHPPHQSVKAPRPSAPPAMRRQEMKRPPVMRPQENRRPPAVNRAGNDRRPPAMHRAGNDRRPPAMKPMPSGHQTINKRPAGPPQSGFDKKPSRPPQGSFDKKPSRPPQGGFDKHPSRPPHGFDKKPNRPPQSGFDKHPSRPPQGGFDKHPSKPPQGGFDKHPSRPPQGGFDKHPSRPPQGGFDKHPSRPPQSGFDKHPNRPPQGGFDKHPSRPPQGSFDKHPPKPPHHIGKHPHGKYHPPRLPRHHSRYYLYSGFYFPAIYSGYYYGAHYDDASALMNGITVCPADHPNIFLLNTLMTNNLYSDNNFAVFYSGQAALDYDEHHGTGAFYRLAIQNAPDIKKWRSKNYSYIPHTYPTVTSLESYLSKYHFIPSSDTLFDGKHLYRFDADTNAFVENQTIEGLTTTYKHGKIYLIQAAPKGKLPKYYLVLKNAIYETDYVSASACPDCREINDDTTRLWKMIK